MREENKNQIFNLPEYSVPYSQFIWQSTRALMSSKDEFLSQIKGTEYRGPTNIRSDSTDDESNGKEMKTKFDLSMPFIAIQTTNIDEFLIMIENAAESGLSSLMPQIFSHLGRVCDVNGQTVDGTNRKLFDQLLDGLEKMDISFDDEGKHNLTLILPPKLEHLLHEAPPTEEQLRRHEEILERKRVEYFAKKRTRRLR